MCHCPTGNTTPRMRSAAFLYTLCSLYPASASHGLKRRMQLRPAAFSCGRVLTAVFLTALAVIMAATLGPVSAGSCMSSSAGGVVAGNDVVDPPSTTSESEPPTEQECPPWPPYPEGSFGAVIANIAQYARYRVQSAKTWSRELEIGLRERYGSLYERMNEDRNEEVIYGQKKKEHNQLQLKFGVIILQPNPSEDPAWVAFPDEHGCGNPTLPLSTACRLHGGSVLVYIVEDDGVSEEPAAAMVFYANANLHVEPLLQFDVNDAQKLKLNDAAAACIPEGFTRKGQPGASLLGIAECIDGHLGETRGVLVGWESNMDGALSQGHVWRDELPGSEIVVYAVFAKAG